VGDDGEGLVVTRLAPYDGGVRITFEAVEVAALRDLGRQLGDLYAGGVPEHGADPIRDRLFPRAYVDPTEDQAERELQSVVHDDLVAGKTDALDALLDSLGTGEGGVVVDLDAPALDGWVRALNDVRLAVGTAIGITEDDDDRVDSPELATYDWLTWLQGMLVETMLEGPGPERPGPFGPRAEGPGAEGP
jgi:hypothetical protein